MKINKLSVKVEKPKNIDLKWMDKKRIENYTKFKNYMDKIG